MQSSLPHLSLALSLALSSLGFSFAGEVSHRSLAAAAALMKPPLPRGIIVTAERIGDVVKYDSVGQAEPADVSPERLVFEIGSISKVFTALLLAQAVLEKKLTLDTPLRELLGKEQTFADSRVAAITLRQLSTHTSGLPRLPPNLAEGQDKADPYAHFDRAKLNAAVAAQKLAGDGPFASSYSNYGVGLLGDGLARLYGKPWATLVKERITDPLAMHDTMVELNAGQAPRFAPAYAGKEPMHAWRLNALVGAGGLRSTAADMLRFGEAMLHPENSPFKEAVAMTLQAHTKNGERGLGWMIGRLDGEVEYTHNGATGGYRSVLQVLPKSDTVRVVLINNAALEAGLVLKATRLENPRTADSSKVLTEAQLAKYEGVYNLSDTVQITVLKLHEQLWSRFTGQGFFRLYPHEQEDRFFMKTLAVEVQFKRVNKEVVSLTQYQNGRELVAKKSAAPSPAISLRSPAELAEYSGTYQLTPSHVFTVKVVGVTLFIQLTGQSFLPVYETHNKDGFECEAVKAAFDFQRGKEGKLESLQLHQNGTVQKAMRAKG